MKTTILACLSLTLLCATAYADTFGTGPNTFDIEFVSIGNADNPDDTTGSPNPAGKVEYAYRMGQFEISEDMIDKANNEGGLGITKDTRGPNKPATSVSWPEAATFVNWLNVDVGGTPAYKFSGSTFEVWLPGDTADYDASNIYRSKRANYFLPSMDEWYKAAYYNAGTVSYGDYPTANGLVPTAVASGTAANTAVYNQSFATGPAGITQAGGLSPYGTMGQGGNVWEWEETDGDLANGPAPGSSARGIRGGFWSNISGDLSSSVRGDFNPSFGFDSFGFRVASIPEPSTLLLGALAGIGLMLRRRGLTR